MKLVLMLMIIFVTSCTYTFRTVLEAKDYNGYLIYNGTGKAIEVTVECYPKFEVGPHSTFDLKEINCKGE